MNYYQLKNRGAASNILTAAVSIGVTVILSFAGWVASAQGGLEDKVDRNIEADTGQEGRISQIEGALPAINESLKRIEGKLDGAIGNKTKATAVSQ